MAVAGKRDMELSQQEKKIMNSLVHFLQGQWPWAHNL
jgi:hypothetical protein